MVGRLTADAPAGAELVFEIATTVVIVTRRFSPYTSHGRGAFSIRWRSPKSGCWSPCWRSLQSGTLIIRTGCRGRRSSRSRRCCLWCCRRGSFGSGDGRLVTPSGRLSSGMIPIPSVFG